MTHRAEQQFEQTATAARNTTDNLDTVRNYTSTDLRTALAAGSREATGMEYFPTGGSLIDSLNSKSNSDIQVFTNKAGDKAHATLEGNRLVAGAERNQNGVEQLPKEQVDPQAGHAASILDQNFPQFKNERDNLTMSNLHFALMSGDTQALSATIGQLKNDPNRLQYLMQALNQSLIDSGSGMRVNVNKSGDRVTIAGMGENAVQISVDGRASVRQVTGFDGGSFQYGAQVYNASPEGTLKAMAAGSRLNVIFNSFLTPRLER